MQITDTWKQDGYTYAYCKCDDVPEKKDEYKVFVNGLQYIISKTDVDFMIGLSGARLIAFRLPGNIDIPKGQFAMQ